MDVRLRRTSAAAPGVAILDAPKSFWTKAVGEDGSLRTVKSFGSDAPVLASSSQELTLRVDDGGKKAGHQDDLV